MLVKFNSRGHLPLINVRSFKPHHPPSREGQLEKGKGERAWVCEAAFWTCKHHST